MAANGATIQQSSDNFGMKKKGASRELYSRVFRLKVDIFFFNIPTGMFPIYTNIIYILKYVYHAFKSLRTIKTGVQDSNHKCVAIELKQTTRSGFS